MKKASKKTIAKALWQGAAKLERLAELDSIVEDIKSSLAVINDFQEDP